MSDDIIDFNISFPVNHFTVSEFDTMIEREIKAFKAAMLSYGDVFKAEASPKPTLAERVAMAFVKKHNIHLTHDMIRYSDYSNYIAISGLVKLRQTGVTELNVTYENRYFGKNYTAVIPMSAIEPNQNSISITFKNQNSWGMPDYIPNPNTKWGSYFKKED